MTHGHATPLPPPKERRALRESQELTQAQVAAKVGVTRETVRSWETGRTNPRGRKREAYAQLLAQAAAERGEVTETVADTKTQSKSQSQVQGQDQGQGQGQGQGQLQSRSGAQARAGQRTRSGSKAKAEAGAMPKTTAKVEPEKAPGTGPGTEPGTGPDRAPDKAAAKAVVEAAAEAEKTPHPDKAQAARPDAPRPTPALLARLGKRGPATRPATRPANRPVTRPTTPRKQHGPAKPPAPTAPAVAVAAATSPGARAVHAAVKAPVDASVDAPSATEAPDIPDIPDTPADEAARLTPDQAFDALYAFTAPALVRQTYLLTGRRALAKEAVEQAFHQAWEHWPEVAVDRDPVGWVRAAAYEYALSPWHRLRRRHREPDAPPAEPEDRKLLDALLSLPPSYRRTLVLYDGIGLGLPETAAETEASTPAAAHRLLHAREAVAEQLPELAEPEELQRRLDELARAEKLSAPGATVVRQGSEHRSRFWTRAAIAFTALIIGASVLALATSPTSYEPERAPGESVSGVPPRMGPGRLSQQDRHLREKLEQAEPANGPERLVPQAE